MPLAAPQPARVMRWIDGDTVIVKRPSGLERVRLIGIDAPDRLPESRATRQASMHGLTAHALARLGREAWTTAQQLAAPGSRIFLQMDRVARDAHGDQLAYVFAETGELLNLELVSRGAAWTTRDVSDLRYGELLANREAAARARKMGIWAVAGTNRVAQASRR